MSTIVGKHASGTDNQEGEWQRRYTYDRWGNRPKVERYALGVGWCTKQTMDFKHGTSGEPLTNRPTNSQDYSQCNFQPAKVMLYDAAGNTTAYGAQKLLYDGESRLALVLDDIGATVGQYTYDAANRRVKKIAGGVTTNYVWEGSHVIAEYNGATGALIAEYVYAGARMLAEESGGTVKYYHQDRLSARVLTDVSGNIAAQMSHEPFGEQLVEREEVNKWRFTSYERDGETSSDYAVNRQYGTTIGRFMRPDPVPGNIANPQTLNRYAYVANDPVNSVDPIGLLRLVCITTLAGPIGRSDSDTIVIGVTEITTCYWVSDYLSPRFIFTFGGGGGGTLGGFREVKLPFRKQPPRRNPCPNVVPTSDPLNYLRSLSGGSGPSSASSSQGTTESSVGDYTNASIGIGRFAVGAMMSNKSGNIYPTLSGGVSWAPVSASIMAGVGEPRPGVYISVNTPAVNLSAGYPGGFSAEAGVGSSFGIGLQLIDGPLQGSSEADIRRQRSGHLGSSVGRCPY